LIAYFLVNISAGRFETQRASIAKKGIFHLVTVTFDLRVWSSTFA